MAFLRSGTCNRCGECCGYPRATDGGQNNPWPNSWPGSIQSWSAEAIALHLPILQFAADMVNTPNGQFTLQGKKINWTWVADHGLCTGTPTAWDQRCPMLGAKQGDGTVPCRLVGTRYENVWTMMCQPVPPDEFEKPEEVDNWYAHCPSCSFVYTSE